jgi:hypothetical protein
MANVRTYLMITELMPLWYDMILKRYMVTDRNTVCGASLGVICVEGQANDSHEDIFCAAYGLTTVAASLGTLCVKTACRRLCGVGKV